MCVAGTLLTVEEAAQWVLHAAQLPQEVADAFVNNMVTGYDFPELAARQVRKEREEGMEGRNGGGGGGGGVVGLWLRVAQRKAGGYIVPGAECWVVSPCCRVGVSAGPGVCQDRCQEALKQLAFGNRLRTPLHSSDSQWMGGGFVEFFKSHRENENGLFCVCIVSGKNKITAVRQKVVAPPARPPQPLSLFLRFD